MISTKNNWTQNPCDLKIKKILNISVCLSKRKDGGAVERRRRRRRRRSSFWFVMASWNWNAKGRTRVARMKTNENSKPTNDWFSTPSHADHQNVINIQLNCEFIMIIEWIKMSLIRIFILTGIFLLFACKMHNFMNLIGIEINFNEFFGYLHVKCII